ncbi:MAG: DUF92 domain-containing protein [Methanomassiliicoccales archaeon]|nr:MAG: DUF92 domain-containing protein [Methanomassiliicoccales archaeon]
MTSTEELVLVLGLCGLLSFISFRFELLTASGSVASFLIGSLIGVLGSIGWLALLIVFALTGFMVTRYKFEVKRRKGLQEGTKGERTWRNVVANGLVPLLVAVIFYLSGDQGNETAGLVYLCAIGTAASDTIASEMGVLSPRTRSIITFKRVEAGTNGGISLYGTAWAFLGACFASAVGWAVLFPGELPDVRIMVPAVMGFVGCNIDSVIGATLENRGYVGKLGTNVLSMAAGSALGYMILILAL